MSRVTITKKAQRWTPREIEQAVITLLDLDTPNSEIRKAIVKQYGKDPDIMKIVDKVLR